jgi:hypothetical protein
MTRQRLIPPSPEKSLLGGFTQLSRVIPGGKTQTARCQPTRRGMKETSRPRLRYKGCGHRVPSMGPQKCQLLVIPCVTLSLALFALGSADPSGGFCLRTWSCCRPTTILGSIFDMFTVSHDVGAMSCKELERRVNMCLLLPFTAPVRDRCFASSVVTPRGYKAYGWPCTNLHPLARTLVASSPPSLHL